MAKKVPTEAEIIAEMKKLDKMKPKVRRRSMFGDDNHEAIDAQLHVLSNKLTEADIYSNYDTGDDNNGEVSTHVLDSALDAYRWMQGEEVAPSESWEGLTK
jgi:hypothetical protein